MVRRVDFFSLFACLPVGDIGRFDVRGSQTQPQNSTIQVLNDDMTRTGWRMRSTARAGVRNGVQRRGERGVDKVRQAYCLYSLCDEDKRVETLIDDEEENIVFYSPIH